MFFLVAALALVIVVQAVRGSGLSQNVLSPVDLPMAKCHI
jgi:hypothetical protein